MCWREVKCDGDRPTSAQDGWLDQLAHTCGDADVRTERDLHDGSVRVEVYGLNGLSFDREPWIPDGAMPEEAAHRRALYER